MRGRIDVVIAGRPSSTGRVARLHGDVSSASDVLAPAARHAGADVWGGA